MREFSMAAVGIEFPNPNGSNRRFEIRTLTPGAPIDLRPEPKNKHDSRAVEVIAPSGLCIGYLSAERCGWIGGKIAAGDEVAAIFQEEQVHIAVIRVRIGGGAPTLPRSAAPPRDEEPDWGC